MGVFNNLYISKYLVIVFKSIMLVFLVFINSLGVGVG